MTSYTQPEDLSKIYFGFIAENKILAREESLKTAHKVFEIKQIFKYISTSNNI